MEAAKAMRALAGYTADQWGLVTTAQANIAGVDNETLARLVEAGLLDHVRRGAYAATAAGDDAIREQKAAWLLLNPSVPAWRRPRVDPHGGVLSHRTAALIHRVGDLPAGTIEFTVPRRRASKHPDLSFRIAQLPDNDVTLIDGLPVTTVERTIADLIADHIDGGHATDIIEQALRRGQVEPDTLVARLEQNITRQVSRKKAVDAEAKINRFQENLVEIRETGAAVDALRENLAIMLEEFADTTVHPENRTKRRGFRFTQ